MQEVNRILDQINRAFQKDAWHGPSLLEIIADVTSAQAATKMQNVNSIWQIVLHIITWKDVVQKRLSGKRIDPTFEEDWPLVQDRSEIAWENTKIALHKSHTRLCETVSKLKDSQLDETVPGFDYSNYVLLHGVIQHDLYHMGQIALLKKNI